MEAHTESRLWTTDYEVIDDNTSVLVKQCFACSLCNKCLAGTEAVLLGGKVHCWQCYRELFSIKCASCSKSLSGRSNLEFVYYNSGVWHKSCFRCSVCRASLQEREPVQEGRLLRCKPCYESTKFYIV